MIVRGLRWGVLFAAAAALLASLAVAPSSARAEAEVVVNSDEPELKGDQVMLAFTNASDTAVTLSVRMPSNESCKPALETSESGKLEPTARLEPEKVTRVTMKVPAGCESVAGKEIELTPDPAKGTVLPFVIKPKGATAESTPWLNLWAYAIAFGAALLGALLFFFRSWKVPAGASRSLFQPLTHVDSAWKLDENWGTNIVALAAPLAALFGATVTKSFLGEDAESLVALVTVGAAITAVTVLLAPLALVAFKSHRWDEKKKEHINDFTVGGVLLAGVLVLTGAYGLLWVAFKTASKFKLDGLEHWYYLAWPFLLVALLFLIYAFRSTKFMLEGGTETPAETASTTTPATLDHSWSVQLGNRIFKVTHSEPVPVPAPAPAAPTVPTSAPAPTKSSEPADGAKAAAGTDVEAGAEAASAQPAATAATSVAAVLAAQPLMLALPASEVRRKCGLTSGLL